MNTYNLTLGLKNVILTESSPVDDFYYDEILSVESNEKERCYKNPLHLLLNQQRLNSLGTMGVQAWLEQFQARPDSPLAELRKKCSDEDLATMIKSRHLQAPAEILAWSRQMYDNMESFNNELKQLAAQQVQQTESTQVTDNTNTE